jgi:hypothetical protein
VQPKFPFFLYLGLMYDVHGPIPISVAYAVHERVARGDGVLSGPF